MRFLVPNTYIGKEAWIDKLDLSGFAETMN